MNRRSLNRPLLAVAGAAAALAVVLASMGPANAHNGDDHTTPPAPGGSTSKAQVIEGNLHDIPVGPLTVANWPAGPTHAVLAGSQHVLDFGILEANAAGSLEEGWVSADAAVASISGGISGVLTIDLGAITSECRSDLDGQTGSASIAGGSISVLGYPALKIPLNPAPNTTLSIPGVIDIVLNKQVVNPDGSLTVTALDIHGSTLLQTLLLTMHPLYLTVAQSTCDEYVPPLAVPSVAVAGEGTDAALAGAGIAAGLVGAGALAFARRRTSASAV